MNKKNLICLMTALILTISIVSIPFLTGNKKEKQDTKKMEATVLATNGSSVTVQDKNNVIYTFEDLDLDILLGSHIVLEYTGLLDKNKNIQGTEVINYTTTKSGKDENGIPTSWLDNGIFKDYYILANNKLKTLSLEEKIGQLLLVRYPDTNALQAIKNYHLGGYLFFEKDFTGKTKTQVQQMIESAQNTSKIPLLTAVDEEGGRVVRVSSNPNLTKEKFKSPQELYQLGGFERIKEDTKEKSNVLSNLGLNVNLAPVVDVSTDPSNYIYDRTLGKDTDFTATYATTVIEASKNTGVSYTLKHFPGYGKTQDTHTGGAINNETYEEILKTHLPPFKAGINVGAEAVLVGHSTVNNIDPDNPASLSPSVHNLLRNELKFTGIIMTDELDMKAVSGIQDVAVKAILAGNDLILVTDYQDSFNTIKKAVENKTISEDLIDKLAFRVLAWKYYKGIMFESQK